MVTLRRMMPLLVLLLAVPALAQSVVTFGWSGSLGSEGLPSGWTFSRWSPTVALGSDFEATARVVQDGGRPVLFVRSVRSGFIVGTRRQVDIASTPIATWTWKAETLPTGASFRQRSTNDQALQLLFGFTGGKVVGYIWDSTGSIGATGSGLSWREDVRVMVLQAGPSRVGTWVTERRDLRADFLSLFGEEPPLLGGVAVQCNSQHTGSTGSGWVGEIRLTP